MNILGFRIERVRTTETTQRLRPEGQYDVRRGAAGYAQIVAVFGSLTLPAIILVFTGLPDGAEHSVNAIFALALLVLSLLGTLAGAFGLAAIGAERDPTGNLVPAVMYLAVPISIALESMLTAFGFVAAIFLPEYAYLFALLVGVGGLFAVIFNALTVADSVGMGPRTQAAYDRWIAHQWLRDREEARRQSRRLVAIAVAPIAVMIGLRLAQVHFAATEPVVFVVVVLASIITLVGIFGAADRSNHSANRQHALRRWEAYSTTIAISLFVVMFMIFMP